MLECQSDFGAQRPGLALVVHQAQRIPKLTRPFLLMVLGQSTQFAQ